MIGDYKGNFPYSKFSIITNAPQNIGIYYCGAMNENGSLGVFYVGRAKGESVTIRSRLLDHFNNGEWSDITHFGFRTCSIEAEVESIEKSEVVRLNIPKYNKKVG